MSGFSVLILSLIVREFFFLLNGPTFPLRATAVAQWLRCCATNRKVAGSIPASVSGFFIDTVVPCREHFVLFHLISFPVLHICWKYFKDGLVHFPSRTNRKSGSPIIHIATANVEAAENCCYVNAKIADFGW